METTKDTTYNGWTNYETWAVNLWLTNEPGTAEDLQSYATDDSVSTDSERGDMLKAYVEEIYELPTEGLAADLINASLSRVDWLEIIRNHQED